jgi:hypothetical protein
MPTDSNAAVPSDHSIKPSPVCDDRTWACAFIERSVEAQNRESLTAPVRKAIREAIVDAYADVEIPYFDVSLPEVKREYRRALADVVEQRGCEGAISRRAAALLTHRRKKGLAPR